MGEDGEAFIDALFVVGDNPRRVSPWNDLKQDPVKPTIHGMREFLARFEQLSTLSGYNALIKSAPLVKISQCALEDSALDAASMADLATPKRCAVILAMLHHRPGVVTDDLCIIFWKQMSRVSHAAAQALQQYLVDNQAKTDEILRRYASLDAVLKSAKPGQGQLPDHRFAARPVRVLAVARRVRWQERSCFMALVFANSHSELLRILGALRFVPSSQDASFEHALTFMLAQRGRAGEWTVLQSATAAGLTLPDLGWVPEKWWKPITGMARRKAPTRLHRRQFEACVCAHP